jgi:mRNA interferase RelE/StbE
LIWSVEWDERARKELRRLDRPAQQDILRYVRERLAGSQDPRRFGRALRGAKQALWRYRIGAYRLICQIEDDRLIILVITVGHRRDVYR